MNRRERRAQALDRLHRVAERLEAEGLINNFSLEEFEEDGELPEAVLHLWHGGCARHHVEATVTEDGQRAVVELFEPIGEFGRDVQTGCATTMPLHRFEPILRAWVAAESTEHADRAGDAELIQKLAGPDTPNTCQPEVEWETLTLKGSGVPTAEPTGMWQKPRMVPLPRAIAGGRCTAPVD